MSVIINDSPKEITRFFSLKMFPLSDGYNYGDSDRYLQVNTVAIEIIAGGESMDWQSVLYRWEEYAEKLYPLRDEVAHVFETKCFYDDNWEYQERLYEADDDTVFLMRLSGMLNEICDFVKSHIEVLSHRVEVDEEIRDNLQHAFEAWKRGLCPLLMRNVPHYVLSDKSGWDSFWETYDEVAKCLRGERMNYSATERAIEEFEASRKKLKLSA